MKEKKFFKNHILKNAITLEIKNKKRQNALSERKRESLSPEI